jgi:hypothetical protein
MKYFYLFFMFFSSFAFCETGLYTQILGSASYSNSENNGMSALTGSAIGISGGIRMNTVGFELTAKRFSLNNEAIGDSEYSSKLKDSTFSGGIRLFIQNRFSFKLGIIFHNLEMDIFKNDIRQKQDEYDGDFFGLYAGMGINHKISRELDFYLESNLYPVPQAKFSLIDFEFGLRLYFGG